VLSAHLTGLDNDIYFQVGLITTIGVSAKNAILIVEFAEERMKMGMGAAEAALAAAKLRLRPILMTSFAFIFGVLPLALAHGAGSGGRTRSDAVWSGYDLGDRAGHLLRAGLLRRGERLFRQDARPPKPRRRGRNRMRASRPFLSWPRPAGGLRRSRADLSPPGHPDAGGVSDRSGLCAPRGGAAAHGRLA